MAWEPPARPWISFLLFHIIGWVCVLREWEFIGGDRVDIDPKYQTYPRNDFRIDNGSYVITGKVYKK